MKQTILALLALASTSFSTETLRLTGTLNVGGADATPPLLKIEQTDSTPTTQPAIILGNGEFQVDLSGVCRSIGFVSAGAVAGTAAGYTYFAGGTFADLHADVANIANTSTQDLYSLQIASVLGHDGDEAIFDVDWSLRNNSGTGQGKWIYINIGGTDIASNDDNMSNSEHDGHYLVTIKRRSATTQFITVIATPTANTPGANGYISTTTSFTLSSSLFFKVRGDTNNGTANEIIVHNVTAKFFPKP